MTGKLYNPLDKLNLGKSVAEALLDCPEQPLGAIAPYDGAGIYVIYYRGSHPAYERLARANAVELKVPIYIGKAIPSGGRRGADLFGDTPQGRFLYGRLKEHADSIRAAGNLDIADFYARWLVVDDIWIPLGETLLISKFEPVWNRLVDGFGNHDPGAGRYKGAIPIWDVLHPGRTWATRLQPRAQSQAEIEAEVKAYLERIALPDDPHISMAPGEL